MKKDVKKISAPTFFTNQSIVTPRYLIRHFKYCKTSDNSNSFSPQDDWKRPRRDLGRKTSSDLNHFSLTYFNSCEIQCGFQVLGLPVRNDLEALAITPTTMMMPLLPTSIGSNSNHGRNKCPVNMRGAVVAAHLRSLRSDDPLSKGHPRPIKQRLKL